MTTSWKTISIREEIYNLILDESKKKTKKPTPHLDTILSEHFGVPSLMEVYLNE